MKKYRVLLDTNMLMMLCKGVDVFSQIEDLIEARAEFYVIRQVIEELEKLAREGRPLERRCAKMALTYALRKCKVLNVERRRGERVDDLIVRVAESEGYIVATNDRVLRRRLRDKGIPEIYFREEKQLLEAQGIE